MNNHAMASVLLAMLFGATPAIAADGKVTISSPSEGATIAAGTKIKLSYAANPGKEGDHLHLYADAQRIDVIRQLKGTTEVDALPPGKHKLCLEVNTKGHVPTSPQSCVDITVK